MVYRREYPKKLSRDPYNDVVRSGKSDQPQRVNRAGKSDQPQRVNRAGKDDQPQRVARAGKGDKKGVGVSRVASATTPAAPPKKAAVAPSRAPQKPSFSKGPASGKMAFSGNWQGAAPSEMQKRGGARINRNGGILGAIRRKLG